MQGGNAASRLAERCNAAYLDAMQNGHSVEKKDKTIMALSYLPIDPRGEIDLLAIERQARAMQAQVLADGFRALRRGIVALVTRRPVHRAA